MNFLIIFRVYNQTLFPATMISDTKTIFAILTDKRSTIDWNQLLTEILTAFDCSTATIHTLDKDSQLLHLKAYQGIPELLLPKMTIIPTGKGMAGVAAERKRPVQICNLQTDESGVVRPSAKETKVKGSMAVPLMLNGQLHGTLGIAKPVPYEFIVEEEEILMEIGEAISRKIVS
ncbi:GAF domain-containing protein [Nostoc sp. ChiSLP03a]|uniref:GAF domain-containing protein n=1 Tax=Nostoc sp. ChiSLP03a TaxID=3075380 RepID=UPI002AD41AF3|nr:GAF domain-containing protein [Nostoc sp. ChiSLP03a]MDZ8211037.1 GAF domain-containing protein [Nostoc sp. ChiSLP03a]